VAGTRGGVWAAIAVAAALAWAAPARAFDLEGHSTIEATAYKRLLALERVPDTDVSGRTLLAALVREGVLRPPPCFGAAGGLCGPEARPARPLAFWPIVGSGAADLIIDRQLSAHAQCQHFMAETDDGLTPPDPRTGVPVGLETTAVARCVRVLELALDGILRDPRRASGRLVGMYALIHAVEDSFSAAHAARGADGHIEHLLSWTLLDWPARLGRGDYPAETHHAVTDKRDGDYLDRDARAGDGTPCAEIPSPYGLPEACLTPRARSAASAVVDLLVVTYRLRARARAEARPASLEAAEDHALWERFVAAHLASVAASPAAVAEALPGMPSVGRPRPDTFLGLRGSITREGGWGASLWGTRFFYGPAVPFALVLSGGVGWNRDSGSDDVIGALGLGLVLPLVRRFAFGFAPLGLAVQCDTGFDHCGATPYATLGLLLVPLPHMLWLGLEGPRWSWDTRAIAGSVFALSLGWAHEGDPHAPDLDAAAARAWDPPRPGEVATFRAASITAALSFAATAASTARDQWIGGALELRWDRDRWNRRAGLGPALAASYAHGTLDGTKGDAGAVGPALVAYVLPGQLAVVARPATLRVGAQGGQALGVDVGGSLSVLIDVAQVELAVDSPPLSYLSRDRWHALPLAVRLGLLLH
jgi:hypothetical protein